MSRAPSGLRHSHLAYTGTSPRSWETLANPYRSAVVKKILLLSAKHQSRKYLKEAVSVTFDTASYGIYRLPVYLRQPILYGGSTNISLNHSTRDGLWQTRGPLEDSPQQVSLS